MNTSAQQLPRLAQLEVRSTQNSAAAFEKHFSPDELGAMWGLSSDTLRRVFEKEPGVLVIEGVKSTSRRRYRTIRVPESVALRVHRRLTVLSR